MSIFVLLTGVLHKDAVSRISQNGNAYVTCTVRVEQDGQTVWANVICFDDLAQGELMRLTAGDALSLQGKATPKVYMKDDEARPSLQITATTVICLKPKTQPKQAYTKTPPRQNPKTYGTDAHRAEDKVADDGFDDPLPF